MFAKSSECFEISFNANAEILFKFGSGSCKAKTIAGTHPESATDLAKFSLCLAMYASAQIADYFTPGSNSSTQIAKDSKTPLLMIAFDNELECFANDLRTKHAAFL
jgi:hypothetical protein